MKVIEQFMWSCNLVPRVIVTLIQWQERATRTSGIKCSARQDSWTSGSTVHVFDSMFQQRDAKILGLPVLQHMSGATLYSRGPVPTAG